MLITAQNLRKRYSNRVALDRVSLEISEGECLGIFGRSGAGKSTLLRLLAGMEIPDSGSLTCNCRSMAVSSQSPCTDGNVTPSEVLRLFAVLYGIPKGKRRSAIREVLSLVGLDEKRDSRVNTLSTGSQRRLEMAKVLLSPAEILLLDDPMAGLDYASRDRLWKHLLRACALDARSVVIATSRPEDAVRCKRIALLHQGRLLATGTPEELRGLAGQEAVVIEPVSSGEKHSPRRAVVTENGEDMIVNGRTDSVSENILKQMSAGPAVVRLQVRTLDSILDELAEKNCPA